MLVCWVVVDNHWSTSTMIQLSSLQKVKLILSNLFNSRKMAWSSLSGCTKPFHFHQLFGADTAVEMKENLSPFSLSVCVMSFKETAHRDAYINAGMPVDFTDGVVLLKEEDCCRQYLPTSWMSINLQIVFIPVIACIEAHWILPALTSPHNILRREAMRCHGHGSPMQFAHTQNAMWLSYDNFTHERYFSISWLEDASVS